MNGRVTFDCGNCGCRDVAGWIFVDETQARETAFKRSRAEKELETQSRGSLVEFLQLTEELPDSVWEVRCFSCFTDRSELYAFTTDRADTVAKLLSWTVHFTGKVWWGYTNWEQFLRNELQRNQMWEEG